MIQKIDDLLQQPTVVEQIRNRTQQVAQQIPGSWLRTDIEDNSIEMDHQAEEIQV